MARAERVNPHLTALVNGQQRRETFPPQKLEYIVCYNESMVSRFVFGEGWSLNPFKTLQHFRI